MQTYTVKTTRFINGGHRATGETVSLIPAQAKYYLPPHADDLELIDETAADADVDASDPELPE